MAAFEGVFFFVFGIALLMYDYRAWTTGTIRIGHPNRGETHMADSKYVVNKFAQPVLFFIFFIFYAVVGIGCMFFSLRLFTGNVDPLSLGIIQMMQSQ